MNRRSFVGGVVAIAAVPSVSVVAQTSTPTPEPRYIYDIANLRGVMKAVTRYAEASSLGFESALSGDLAFVDSWGFRFRSQSHANLAPRELLDAYEKWITLDLGRRLREVNKASVRELGDASWGWTAEISSVEDRTELYPWALLAVRKKTTVQVMVGAAIVGQPLRRLADISEKTLDRWPNTKPRSTYDGEPTGGIWDTLPRLEDLEEGMVIDYSGDVSDEF